MPLPALTFLVLQPELLLGLLAGEVDAAAELGAVQRLRHVVAAVLLEERQQLVASARRRQRLQHLGKAWRGRERRGEGRGGGVTLCYRAIEVSRALRFMLEKESRNCVPEMLAGSGHNMAPTPHSHTVSLHLFFLNFTFSLHLNDALNVSFLFYSILFYEHCDGKGKK